MATYQAPNFNVGLGPNIPTLNTPAVSNTNMLANTNFDLLYANQNAAPMGVGLSMPGMQVADPSVGLDVGNFNVPQTNQTGLGNFGTMDYLNAAQGAIGLGLGAYYQNRQLGLQEDQLALSQQKYSDYRADKDALTAANTQRNANAIAKGA